MDKKIFNLARWLEGKRAPPYILELRPTYRCNLNCISCGQSKKPFSEELPGERLFELVKEAACIDVSRIELCGGGEPLMRAETVQIMLLIKKLGMEGCITTNGTLFTEKVVKDLVKQGWDEILLSLDSPDAKTHDYLRQKKGCFDSVIRNLKLFKKWKQKLNSPKPVIKLVPVLSNRNYKKLEDFMKLAKLYNIPEIRFQPLFAFTKEHKLLKLSYDDIKKLPPYVERANILAKKYNIDTNVDIFLKELFTDRSLEIYKSEIKSNPVSEPESEIKTPLLSAPCFIPWYYMGIDYDGKILLCPAFNRHKAKKIKKKSLLTIWYSETFEKLRNTIIQNKLHSHCKRCCGGLIINNKDIRKQLYCYAKIKHMNFSDLVSMIDDAEQKIRRDERIKNLEKGITDFQNSLSFKIGSKLEKSPAGKFLKYLNKKWTKK